MKHLCAAILLSAMVATVAIASRPILPIDETRYVGVAWEAYARGDLLVSHLNGNTYAHKPPLLFWLINLVWSVFGVSELGARVVAPVIGILCLPLVYWLGLKLWPEDHRTAKWAPLVLASFSVWLLFSPLTMFDSLLTLTVLMAICGLVRVRMGGTWSGWFLVGLGMGLGILSKGPVVFVHTLPIALLGAWWARDFAVKNPNGDDSQVKISWTRWYLGTAVAMVLAGTIGLGWAIPSALLGGPEYANELLWGQTAGRVTKSFSHRHPFYWYAPILPMCLLPWLFTGTLWRGLKQTQIDWGVRLLICWIAAPLTLLSFVSGKQVHYLMPILPAFAIFIARSLSSVHLTIKNRDTIAIASGTILVGCLPLLLNSSQWSIDLGLSGIIPNWFVPALILNGLAIYLICRRSVERLVMGLSSITAFSISLMVAAGAFHFWNGFSVQNLASYFRQSDAPIVWYGEYHDQLNFAGRMSTIDAALTAPELFEWMARNPDSIVVTRLTSTGDLWQRFLKTEATQVDPQPTLQQQEMLRDILAQREEFAAMASPPSVESIFWIRLGLKKKPYVALRIRSEQTATLTADKPGAPEHY